MASEDYSYSQAQAEKEHYSRNVRVSPGLQQAKTSSRSGFEKANDALNEAMGLSLRVQSLVGRLCGSVPVGVPQDTYPQSDGIFHAMGYTADTAIDQIRVAMSELNRLEQHLP